MLYIIRRLTLLSFIALALLNFACDIPIEEKTDQSHVGKPLIKPEKGIERPKIIAFGDSLTAGFGLTEDESYPYLLQKTLEKDGFSYEVVNAGVSGDTSLGGLERIDWILESENIEVIILELGANDLLRGVPVANMKANLEKIIRKAKAKNIRVLLCGMLAPDTMGKEYQAEYIKAFPDLASKYKLKFLPFLLEGVALDPKLNQADGIHPNAEGTKIMTKNVYGALKEILKKK